MLDPSLHPGSSKLPSPHLLIVPNSGQILTEANILSTEVLISLNNAACPKLKVLPVFCQEGRAALETLLKKCLYFSPIPSSPLVCIYFFPDSCAVFLSPAWLFLPFSFLPFSLYLFFKLCNKWRGAGSQSRACACIPSFNSHPEPRARGSLWILWLFRQNNNACQPEQLPKVSYRWSTQLCDNRKLDGAVAGLCNSVPLLRLQLIESHHPWGK